MRQVTRKGLITVAAASGVLAVTGGTAFADSGADGKTADSPGVLAGNTVQLPINIPVNLCGNTVNVVGLLNPAAGNSCANVSDGGGSDSGNNNGGKDENGGGATAEGSSKDSPGVGSGNVIQLPIDVPVNACGNSVTIGGLGNGTEGNDCTNESAPKPPVNEEPPAGPEKPEKPVKPGKPDTPDRPDKPSKPNEPETHTVTPPKGSEQLARTGSDLPVGMAVPVSAGLLLAGAVLYRRARQAA